MRRDVTFNGKFLSAAPTGVHRVAEELIRHIDLTLARDPESARERGWQLLKPRDADRSLNTTIVDQRTAGRLTWQPWEQFELPWLARGTTLVSLCNLAPIASREGITMIHDAQVFISPASYGRAFGAWYRFALPAIGRSSRLILTVSNYSRRMLAEHGVAPLDKIEVIHNGVDHLADIPGDASIVSRLNLTAGEFVVALANTQEHKNIRVLLQTFRRPAMRGVSLVLVGRNGPADFEAAGESPSANVVFAGPVPDGELRALFENAACIAFPSTTEGFGLPPLEAMSLGCPAVVAPCGALPEVCGEAALYAAPDNAAEWESRILELCGSPTERAKRAALGKAQAAQFSWARSAEQLLRLVRNVADM
jgi:glycosyltransferase involved in cell wall biosynthesis